jgi:hypothetical protein
MALDLFFDVPMDESVCQASPSSVSSPFLFLSFFPSFLPLQQQQLLLL